jgi:tetratricopeptide (TPR) repeat protein
MYATKPPFSFFAKAQYYYRSEIAKSTDKSLDNTTIDSILNKNTTTLDFDKAYSVSWRIGLFLLEQGKHPKALDIFNDMLSFLESRSPQTREDREKISSVYNITGAIYEETGLWNEALDLYMHSLQICNENNNKAGQAKVYNNIGKLYFSRNELTKAGNLFNKAIGINKGLNIRPELFNNYNNLAGVFKRRNDLAKALEYALIALNQLDVQKDFYSLSIVYSNIGSLYQDMGNNPVALSYYQQAAGIEERKSFQVAMIGSYLSISSVYKTMHNTDSAVAYLSRSLKLAGMLGNPSEKLNVFQVAAAYYKQAGDYRKSAEYYAEYLKLNDSLESLNSLTKIEQIQSVYELINKEKNNKILQQKIDIQQLAIQRQRILLGAGMIIFLFLGYFVVNLQRNRKRERLKNTDLKTQSDLLHQKEKDIMLDEEHSLKLELDYKNRQLTSYALHMARNNEFISITSDELKQILLGLNPREKEKSEQIRNLLSKLHQYSSGNDWEEFRLYFQEVHQSFDKNLSTAFPDLSPNDKKICALLKLGLSTKDISSITFREVRSVESARNRLRKKLGLAAEVNIVNFLSQF